MSGYRLRTERLRALARGRGITPSAPGIAAATGLPERTLQRLFAGAGASAATIADVTAALDCPVDELFERVGDVARPDLYVTSYRHGDASEVAYAGGSLSEAMLRVEEIIADGGKQETGAPNPRTGATLLLRVTLAGTVAEVHQISRPAS